MSTADTSTGFEIRTATVDDVPLILDFIHQLADYERLAHEVEADIDTLRESLFGERRVAEALLGYLGGEPVAFAVFFHNFSTFVGRPGLYLEDVFVKPAYRGRGFGQALLVHLARIAMDRGCGRFEWSVLDWNESAIHFYQQLGARAMDDWTVYRVDGEALETLAESR
jgi:GNAT superfamily N-acetyltransferase